MAKGKTSIFFCQNCGYESAKWMGQCPGCREWNTFVQESVPSSSSASGGAGKGRLSGRAKPMPLIEVDTEGAARAGTGIGELDRVLGGGIVRGSLVLVGGDPGIGKSTLLLQVCRNISGSGRKVLYVSGEESPQQIRMRADRMGSFSREMMLLCETSLDGVRSAIEEAGPSVVVIDSIQTMYSEDISSAPGSVSQVRESTAALMQTAKVSDVSIFIVGHVTKEGVVAGPRVLEHMVDTVLYFEGDRNASYRILRSVKNRFGSTNEIGVFEMCHDGLREVTNPSEFMLSGRPENSTGSVVSCSMEGTRPVLIEIQALTSPTTLAYPRRTVDGADINRVNLLLAVLEKRMGLRLSSSDVYVNIAGGIRMREPAVDLGLVMALISSARDIAVSDKTIAFGEVGLGGEIRAVSMAKQRVMEAARLGFDTVILPQVGIRTVGKIEGVRLHGVRTLRDLPRIMGRPGA